MALSHFYRVLLKRSCERETLGNSFGGCAWTICPDYLGASSIVYSGGVGNDISFEHELVKRFACNIVLCDPSPTGARTMELTENRIAEFRFFPMALGKSTGKLKLAAPLNREGDWWLPGNSEGDLEVQCTDLQSLMHRNGHTFIDLLKLDIEGSEYSVIEDLLARHIPVRQVCVEYHHGLLPGIPRRRTIASILNLLRDGYNLIDQSGANHTFLRKQWSPPQSART